MDYCIEDTTKKINHLGLEKILLSENKKRLRNMLHCDSTECWSGECIP